MVYLYPGARVWLYGLYNSGLVQGIELMGSGMGQRFRVYGLRVQGLEGVAILQAKVYRQSFWMKIYNHTNYKRTVCWSTSPALRGLFFARLPKGSVNKKKVVRRGIKNGKEIWTGTALLKGTEPLCCKAR